MPFWQYNVMKVKLPGSLFRCRTIKKGRSARMPNVKHVVFPSYFYAKLLCNRLHNSYPSDILSSKGYIFCEEVNYCEARA